MTAWEWNGMEWNGKKRHQGCETQIDNPPSLTILCHLDRSLECVSSFPTVGTRAPVAKGKKLLIDMSSFVSFKNG